jgi:hypothetical protein
MDDQTQPPNPVTNDTEMSEDVISAEAGNEEAAAVAETPDEEKLEDTSEDSSEDVGAPTALNLLDVESIIKRHLIDIEKLQGEIKDQRAMFEDSFNNDANYKALADKAKEATRQKNAVKQQYIRSKTKTKWRRCSVTKSKRK